MPIVWCMEHHRFQEEYGKDEWEPDGGNFMIYGKGSFKTAKLKILCQTNKYPHQVSF